jgi:hypothetical protein
MDTVSTTSFHGQQAGTGLFTDPAAQPMLFITGASRSGTTLLSFILRNHSRVFGLKELQYFGEFWDPREPERHTGESILREAASAIFARQEQGILANWRRGKDMQQARALVDALPLERRNLRDVFATAVLQLAQAAGKSIPCEQTPRNIFYAEALLRHYPNAHVIYMMRDPRAVMASQKKRWQRRGFSADRSRFPVYHSLRTRLNYHPYTIVNLWARAAREARRMSNHPRFSLIRFEDLLESPEATVRHLCRCLNIEFEPAMLDVSQINSSHQSSAGGARKGIHKDAIDTWRTILSPGETLITERAARLIMKHYGYGLTDRHNLKSSSELPYVFTYLLHLAGVFAVNPRRAMIQLRAALHMPGRRHSLSGK